MGHVWEIPAPVGGPALRFGTVRKELFGCDPHTTNNRMELMAAIQGLALKEACDVEVTTDSEYVRQGITQWVTKWKRRHWWRKNRPVRNADLWMELDRLVSIHTTDWIWTKGHAMHEDNNRCDWLAQNAARTQIGSYPGGSGRGLLHYNLGSEYIPPKPQGSLFGDPESPDIKDDESDPG